MKSFKKPTFPEKEKPVEVIQAEVTQLAPQSDYRVMSQMSRDGFISMMNHSSEEINRLDNTLSFMTDSLSDKEYFFSLSNKEKLAVFQALDHRQSNLRKDVIRVHEIGARDEFNRNFFGIQARTEEQIAAMNGDASQVEPLTKPAKQVLSEISKFVALRAMNSRIPDGE